MTERQHAIMVLTENGENSGMIDAIIGREDGEELLEVAPKLSLSSIRLLWRLNRAEKVDADTVGIQLSRRYLVDTIARIGVDSRGYSHHNITPKESPHYIETFPFINHGLRRSIAATIVDFLVSSPEPPSDREAVGTDQP